MNKIKYDPARNTLTKEKIESYPDPYKTYNKVNWGQMAMDLLKENHETIQKIKNKENIKEDFYIVELDNADSGYLYLVKATSLKEAIEKVWIQYVEPLNKEIDEYSSPYYKHELHAIKVEHYFDEETDTICLQ
jgi:hypothetical protein